jgi:hypothetical protein
MYPDSSGLEPCCMDPRRGVVLPIVLLLILGFGGFAGSIIVLTSTQRLLGRAELRFLEERIRAERLLADANAVGDGFVRAEIPLPGSFSLVRVTPTGGSQAYFAASWVLDPDSIALLFPGALWARRIEPASGIRALEDCPSVDSRPLVAEPPDGDGIAPAEVAGWPRIGILGLGELLALADSELADPYVLPGPVPPAIRRIGEAAIVRGGRATGVLIAAGDLVMDGSAAFEGLVVVGGDLTLSGSSRIDGVVLAGGSLQIGPSASLFGCPELARRGLTLPPLHRAHPLPEGWFIGRY